jgi:hypothetical protein
VRIECGRCEMYESEHCADCLVTALLHPPAGAIEIDDELDSSLQALSRAGLIPVLKFRASVERAAPGDASARAG